MCDFLSTKLLYHKMSMIILLIALPVIINGNAEGVVVHKAKEGETTILPCPSDDKLHRFQYWLLKNDEVIGPWNNNDKNKYRYEAWSGRLIIRSVSDKESGYYKCFSKKILGKELKSETVELLVMRDWEDSFENDTKVNTYRAIIAVLIILMLVIMGVFTYLIKRRRSFAMEAESREESPDDLISSTNNGVYRATSISLKKPSIVIERTTDKDLENAIVETDISTSFQLSN